jgi:hypothetical protein
MKAVLGAIGLNATPHALHLRMATCSVGYDLLVVWSPSKFALPLSFVRLSSLESLVQWHFK